MARISKVMLVTASFVFAGTVSSADHLHTDEAPQVLYVGLDALHSWAVPAPASADYDSTPGWEFRSEQKIAKVVEDIARLEQELRRSHEAEFTKEKDLARRQSALAAELVPKPGDDPMRRDGLKLLEAIGELTEIANMEIENPHARERHEPDLDLQETAMELESLLG